MNQINPAKLRNSKWTAVKPLNREKHFLVILFFFFNRLSIVPAGIALITSGGFGGCLVRLIPITEEENVVKVVKAEYQSGFGLEPHIYFDIFLRCVR